MQTFNHLIPVTNGKPFQKDGKVCARVGNCEFCGQAAGVSTPLIVDDKLCCFRCQSEVIKDKDEFFYGLHQWVEDWKYVPHKGYDIIHYHDLVCHTNAERTHPAFIWWNFGRHSWPLDDNLRPLTPEKALITVHSLRQQKIFKCTGCKDFFDDKAIAGYPLFSGVVCSPCWEKHKQKLEEQKKAGHVCSMCGQPYDNCCC